MKVAVVIPARFGSTRYPGKPLEPILGKPMLSWVIAGVGQSQNVQKTIVATDDSRIFDLAVQEGAAAKMTAPELPSGTDRVWAAIKDEDCDIVVNVQGDEPLIQAHHIDRVVEPLLRNPEILMATLAHPFQNIEDFQSLNAVKVLCDQNGDAIYFSRFPIPHSRVDAVQGGSMQALALRHIGLYAFRKSFLKTFCEMKPTALEQSESLEQLRALFLGVKIRVVTIEHALFGVDTPEDLKKIEVILKETHGHKV